MAVGIVGSVLGIAKMRSKYYRPDVGPLGGFPARAAVGKMGGLMLGMMLLPGCWALCERTAPPVAWLEKTVWVRAAKASIKESVASRFHRRSPAPGRYVVLVSGPENHSWFLTDAMVAAGQRGRAEVLTESGTRVKEGLNDSVYAQVGGIWRIFWGLGVGVLLLVVEFLVGVLYDMQRYRVIRNVGARIRGPQEVSRDVWNQEQGAGL